MAGADIRRYSNDRRGRALNFFLGIASGALFGLADTLLFPSLILALFVAQLTHSYLLLGLIPAIGAGVWFLPQLLAAGLVQGRQRKLPWATAASIIRFAAIALLAYVGLRAGSLNNAGLLRSFFICYVAYSLAAGFAAVPAGEAVAKAIAHEQRPLFLRQRVLWGAILGLAGGFVVHQVLGARGLTFPRPFALIFFAAAVALAAGTFFQARLREPQRVAGMRHGTLLDLLRDGPKVLGDSNFRRFLCFRVLFSLSAIADPFLIVFALRRLHLPLAFAGTYLIAVVLARLASGAIWQPLAARYGTKSVLQVAALIRLPMPLIALLLPYLIDTSLYARHVHNGNVPFYAFGLIYVAYGVALGGQVVGNHAYLMDIAPTERRVAYVGLANLVLAAVSFAPLVGAVILDRYGFDDLFVAAIVLGLAAVFVSGALTDTNFATRPTTEAWRLRRARS